LASCPLETTGKRWEGSGGDRAISQETRLDSCSQGTSSRIERKGYFTDPPAFSKTEPGGFFDASFPPTENYATTIEVEQAVISLLPLDLGTPVCPGETVAAPDD
jgi:hypothetical protein